MAKPVRDALDKMANESGVPDCLPALVEGRRLLKSLRHQGWFTADSWKLVYPKARGNLYGVLIAKLEQVLLDDGEAREGPAQDVIDDVWGELEDDFRNAEGWGPRRQDLAVARSVTKALSTAHLPGTAYVPLWHRFDAYTTHLLAALLHPEKAADLSEICSDYLELLRFSVSEASKTTGAVLDEGAGEARLLLARALRVALLAAMATSRTSEAAASWGFAAAALCENVMPRGQRGAEVQAELDRCVADLNELGRTEASLEARVALSKAMVHLWLINDHDRGGERRRVGLSCVLDFGSSGTVAGVLRNAGVDNPGGFAVELPGVSFFDMEPIEGVWGVPSGREVCDPAWRDAHPVKWVNLRSTRSSLLVERRDEVVLRLAFAEHGGVPLQMSVRCDILRGWTLRYASGIGLALLAPGGQVEPSEWDSWARFVGKRTKPGRYDPENPLGLPGRAGRV